ncbi:hypothetical protein [Acinetobacter sp.]|uniref:hypothetical protein n=1 Tax=Acinetobacter sp. TaxID=472 RepID=UPI003CFDDB0D
MKDKKFLQALLPLFMYGEMMFDSGMGMNFSNGEPFKMKKAYIPIPCERTDEEKERRKKNRHKTMNRKKKRGY